MRSAHRFVAVVAVVGGLLGFAAATASAQEAVYACASRSSGALRVVAAGNPCKAGEFPLTWSVTGPAGPEGPQGPVGPQGPQGAPGDDHVFGVSTKGSLTSNAIDVPEFGHIGVECSANGAPKFHLVAIQEFDFTRIEVGNSATVGRSDERVEDSPPQGLPYVVVYWFDREDGGGGWFVTVQLRPIVVGIPCAVAVSLTRIG